jgi:deoxyribodipyrimidine photo-lyase
MSGAVWWVRRDLRLSDNEALQAAMARGPVLPVFILDPVFASPRYDPASSRRYAFMVAGVRALAEDLKARGVNLHVACGKPLDVLRDLLATTGATSIHAMEDLSPYARRRDAEIAAVLPLELAPGVTVHHPARVLTRQGKPYTVFTPFYRTWRSLPAPRPEDCIPAPTRIPSLPPAGSVATLPALESPPGFPAGEAEAQRRLTRFLEQGIARYDQRRDTPAEDGTSSLSPYFRFGMLSPREAAVGALSAMTAAAAASGAETWLKELVWREFYLAVLFHFPAVLKKAFNPALREIAWREAPADLAAWQQGMTGYPIVDACMRQLLHTGWMHNRGRMIVASFLAKDLLIDWRHGEAWFMDQLIDGDPAANNGGWQWASGVGTDAAPYFRIFNPVTQGERFDPHGHFVRRWVPELAEVPDRYLHAPWTMPPLTASLCGVEIGRDYPAPIVDRAIVRERTLAAYQAAKSASRDQA